MSVFPDEFLWGAATAGHQVEGNNVLSDIWAMEHIPATPFAEPSGDACNSYHLYAEDIELAADAGLNTYRFSIEWSRIEPEEGRFSRAELDHYRDMIEECHRRGLTPVVTLNHFTVPAWFARGGAWSRSDAPELFERYSTRVAEHMGDLVSWWLTFNEPNAGALLLTTGALPLGALGDSPSLSEGQLAIAEQYAQRIGGEAGVASMAIPVMLPAAVDNVFAAHRRSRSALKTVSPTAKVGWSIAVHDFQAAPGGEDRVAKILETAIHPYWAEARNDDFVGVQTYTRQVYGAAGMIEPAQDEHTFQTGWEYYPEALGHTVRDAAAYSGVPVLITENGIATADDEQRIEYTKAALQGLAATIDAGTDVLGYIHWTLLDNWEWHTGFAMTFGLVAVDLETFQRTPKPSLAWLGQVARTHGAAIEDVSALA